MRTGVKNSVNYFIFEQTSLQKFLKRPKEAFKDQSLCLCKKASSFKEAKKISDFFKSLKVVDTFDERYLGLSHAIKIISRQNGLCLSEDCLRAMAYCHLSSATLITVDPASQKVANICEIRLHTI